MNAPAYAELHCLSAFSFQRGASIARELFERAKAQGYAALAITDECSLAGIVRALEASRETEVPLIVGAEFRIDDGPKIVLLCENLTGYQHLCWLITVARRRADKGSYRSLREDFSGHSDGLLCLVCEGRSTSDAGIEWLKSCFPQRLWLAVELHRGADDPRHLQQLQEQSERHGLPMVASGDVHMHVRGRRALQDILTATRHHCTLQEAGWRLFPNGERHLRTRQALAAIHGPELMAETLRITQRCTFDLREINYTYPHELVPQGETATSWLRHLVEEGAKTRWPAGVPPKARKQIEHELGLIAKLGYESYFLTVHDIVRFAREQGILCQGRGSAANSAVCYALGVTELDPERMNLLFERFVSEERKEPPDIDIDFEHERREEVLQYVYRRYGRERAALTAVAISYRGRSAMRDVARAMGLPPDQVDELSRTMGAWSEHAPTKEVLRERGFDPDTPIIRNIIARVAELIGFPRHLSQHPGGFVISEHPLHTLVPVENASMDDRTVVQWDKDDLETMRLMKVDCLALGMLTAVRKTLQMLRNTGRRDLTLATIPSEDPATYDMIGRAETVGVFQIESRAQMAMLPRLKPRTFYDLVIQVAIVRPGPIQGDMVHPYLRRRRGEEPINYPPQLKDVFERTLGVPLFQEQVMQMAVVAAGFTPGEADQLRRSMAAWKRRGGLEPYEQKLTDGMLARGYSREYARELFERIKGFGSYGFPESHAASFALVAYASAWLRCHEPAAFAAGLINSQPLGFYSNDQILQDVRRRGVRVLPVDVRYSDWDCALEFPRDGRSQQPGIRLGLRLIQGLQEEAAERLCHARATRAYADVADLGMRGGLDARHLALLADAGALKGLSGHRHRARWNVSGVEKMLPLFADAPATSEPKPQLPVPSSYDDMRADLASIHTTLGKHPLSFVRKLLVARRYRRSSELAELPHGRRVRFAGIVTMRQRPQTASGVTFVTLEDEDGMVNAVVWQHVAERQHRIFLESRILGVDGRLERVDGVQHLVVDRMENADDLLAVTNRSRDFR